MVVARQRRTEAVGHRRTSRTYDAARTKAAILDAAEEVFAQYGFAGARIDAIATASGYNKSLIYQYFGDKFKLYTEVVKRADEAGEASMARGVADVLADEAVTVDVAKFKQFLAEAVEGLFEFLFRHPRYFRILFWEAAAEWQTWNEMTYRPDDTTHLVRIVEVARDNGIVRSDFDPAMFPAFIMSVTSATLRFSWRFGNFWTEGDTDIRRRHMVEQVCRVVIHGLLAPALL